MLSEMMKDCDMLSEMMKFWWVAAASFCFKMMF